MRSAYRRIVQFGAAGDVVSVVDVYRHDLPMRATPEEETAALVPLGVTDITALVADYPTLADARRATRVEILAALARVASGLP